MFGEHLRDRDELVSIGQNRANAVSNDRALVLIGDCLEAAVCQALDDLALEIPTQLSVERDLGVGQNQPLAFLVWLRHVMYDQRSQAERVDVHVISVRTRASRALSRKLPRFSSKRTTAAG